MGLAVLGPLMPSSFHYLLYAELLWAIILTNPYMYKYRISTRYETWFVSKDAFAKVKISIQYSTGEFLMNYRPSIFLGSLWTLSSTSAYARTQRHRVRLYRFSTNPRYCRKKSVTLLASLICSHWQTEPGPKNSHVSSMWSSRLQTRRKCFCSDSYQSTMAMFSKR